MSSLVVIYRARERNLQHLRLAQELVQHRRLLFRLYLLRYFQSTNQKVLSIWVSLHLAHKIDNIFSKNKAFKANYYEMPGDIGYSQLQIRDNHKTKKKTLAWMTGRNILHITAISIFSKKFLIF